MYDFSDCKSLKPEFATPGATVSLNCSMDGETAPSNITWGKLKGKTSVPVDLERVTINGVHLIIKSVTEKDKGWYKCDYMLSQSPRCLSINLLFKGYQSLILSVLQQINVVYTVTLSIFFLFSLSD